jgi:hypothetical protein
MFVADPMARPNNVYMYTLHPTRAATLTEGPTDAEKERHWRPGIGPTRKICSRGRL